MEITKELRELASFSSDTLPVLSVYLDTQWRDQHQRERVMTFVRRHIRQARAISPEVEVARESLEADLSRIERWEQQLLRGTVEVSTPGFALFACSGAGLWVEFPAPVPFENEFTIADRPTLRQLARLNDDYTNALVVLVDSRTARICEVVLGGFLSEMEFSNEFPGRHKQGGWAQMRYQRHVKDHMDRHHREVADYLASYVAANPKTSIIVSGQETIVTNFRTFLAPHVQQQIIDELRLDIRERYDRVLEVAREVLQRHEREEEHASVQLLFNRSGKGGLAVVGVQETLAAVNTGRVHKLIMNRDFQHQGWRCNDCGRLGEEALQECAVCGGALSPIELGEGLVNGVLQIDGLVEQIEPDADLASYEGVGALLRYK